MFNDRLVRNDNRDLKSHLSPHVPPKPSTSSAMSSSAHRVSATTMSTTTHKKSTTSASKRSGSVRPSSARPLLKPPRNDSSVYFATVGEDGQVNVQNGTASNYHGSSKVMKKSRAAISVGKFERGVTQPGRYMVQARNAAIRRRHNLIARQGELLEKEHLYDC